MKECPRCNRMLPEKSFVFKGKNKKRGNICNNCRYKSRNQNYKTRRNGKRSGYKITEEERQALLNFQNESCAICKEKSILVVDHNHITGKIRGLLCNNCNIGIGMLKDSPEIIKAASQYLIKNDLI